MSEYEDDKEPSLPAFSEERINKARELLDDGCDGYVLIILSDDQDLKRETTSLYYKGGRMAAIGMMEDFKHRLMNGAV